MKISKLKWKWIKFWGYRYRSMSPKNIDKDYVIYHRRIFNVRDWDKFFLEN